ncbi:MULTISPECIES: DUF5753 domain-containing protein [unclassified Crossiella]|uniref:DUF5753 domain-containing protein n=1 Tax=unclassified Crossiella TaxID=2620835 RepID=UPI001FFE833F|nr:MULTISPECIES: DUF5753 domain-containing protein [unclassified Crossiella]MCK2239736.1 DUF5753 domain-containing protein [Crossiella sp. S99.2]MCK2252431.1 DUF5753 domain-containing protein [Crossiella sp. S99.1]
MSGGRPAIRTGKKLVLGAEIAHMIQAADVTQAVAASYIDTGQGRIAGLLKGAGSITVGDLERLANKLGFTDPEYHAVLRDLRRDNHKRGHWDSGYRRAYHEDMRLLVDVESMAEEIRAAVVEVLPGLAQTRAYIEAQLEGAGEDGGAEATEGPTFEDYVTARLARQEILDGPNPPMVRWVMSESCLRRVWGSRAVMAEAIRHVVKLSRRRNVFAQVLPFDAPAERRSSIGNRFTLMRVPSPGVAGPVDLAYVEGEGRISYLDDKKALKAHDAAWSRLTAAALSYSESREFMEHVAEEFERSA